MNDSRTATEDPDEPRAAPREPLTDPADILNLLGRAGAAAFLFLMTMALLFIKQYPVAILTGGASLLLQLATYRLYRRLRDERMAKAAARDAEGAEVTAKLEVRP